LRSNLQAAICSLSFFAWRRREISFRLPCLMSLLWISATALRSVREFHQRVTQSVRCWRNLHRQLFGLLRTRSCQGHSPSSRSVPGRGWYRPARVRHSPSGWPLRPECISVCNQSTKNQKGAHFNCCKNNADGAKDSLGRRNTREFLREIQSSMAAFNTKI